MDNCILCILVGRVDLFKGEIRIIEGWELGQFQKNEMGSFMVFRSLRSHGFTRIWPRWFGMNISA